MWVRLVVVGVVVVALRTLAAAEPPLQSLAAHVGANQGVFAQARDGTVLVSQLAERPVHPASVSKVATSLALLARLGPSYRFETRVLADGPLRDGTLAGDLVVAGGNDPFFVYENAFLVLRRLRALGVARVQGALRAQGNFVFNWKPDPDARRLRETLEGRDGEDAWRDVSGEGNAALHADALHFGTTAGAAGDERVLVRHLSPPLQMVVKALNGYSNNVFHFASDTIGGPPAVEAIARERVDPALRDQIIIENGAGAGSVNRLSPHAAAAILVALEAEAAKHALALTDLLPVSGIDMGTLRERLLDLRGVIVGKTGTFGSEGASALVGMLRTKRYGEVVFAVLNYWLPVPEARQRQDAFVRALVAATGAEPWPYERRAAPDFRAALVE
jgi:D-alanyl-D-alanine carboxypeptidase/D-alanyl-D-alanine-endopeptidase (penicillin-binding protein 4)